MSSSSKCLSRVKTRTHPVEDMTMTVLQVVVSCLIICSAIIPVVTGQYFKHRDLQGDYCKARSDPCCLGRMDDCSQPILGTLCYCDVFCNRTRNPDCCPDYWEVCHGLPPAPVRSCYKNGRYYGAGERIKENCNECVCGQDGNMRCDNDDCLVEEDMLRGINKSPYEYGWSAANYTDFWGRKLSEGLKYKTGTFMPEGRILKMYPVRLFYDRHDLPRRFDARTEWSGSIMGARDQGWCGSSWAFSTLDVYSDRLAIESDGRERDVLSAQNLLNCGKRGQRGCEGGHVDRAWNYLRKRGVVNEECYRYVSGTTQTIGNCDIPIRPTVNNLPCRDNEMMKKRNGMYRSEPAYRISSDQYDIMYEIMTNGPLQVIMKVYDDFFLYKSGIYSHTGLGSGQFATHSVRVVGWGEDRSEKYWIAANSWGQDWGEKGFFRIRRGTNESDIEQFVLAVRAILNDDNRISRRNTRTGGRGYNTRSQRSRKRQ